jgi:hypothetical protein
LERLRSDVDSIDPRCTGRGLDEVQKEIDRGRFSRAVCTEQAENLARAIFKLSAANATLPL